jgi:putative peptidoglycan lipid II flippase
MRFPFLTHHDSVNKKIFRAAVTVGLLGLLAKAGIAAKELIIARSFGRGDALDAFLIAFLLPSFLINLLAGAMGSALVPILMSARKDKPFNKAQEILSSVMFLSVLALILVAIILGVLAHFYLPYVASNFPPAKMILTRQLLYGLLPFVVFGGIATLLGSVLNADEKFALAASAPLLTPLLTIVCIVTAPKASGAWVLAAGTVIGSFFEATLLFCALKSRGLLRAIRWNGFDSNLRSVLRQFAPLLGGAFLMGSTTLVDQSMAALLPAGSVAALSYASKITGALLAIGATALSTAALPYFSRMVAEGDWPGCRNTLKRYCVMVAAATVPLTLLLIAFARPLVTVLLQRGAFTAADTLLVSRILRCYAIQIPFYVCGMLLVRFLSAMRRNDLILYASAVNVVLNIVLNIVLMRQWGIAGIAMSTSLVYVVSFVFVFTCSWKLLAQERFRSGQRGATKAFVMD